MPTSTLSGVDSGADRNPPINTLFVGNIPMSPPLGCTPGIIEDCLRELFQTRLGYEKLLFRQKRTGSMCYVEVQSLFCSCFDNYDGCALTHFLSLRMSVRQPRPSMNLTEMRLMALPRTVVFISHTAKIRLAFRLIRVQIDRIK